MAVDKDRTEGSAKTIVGKVKESFGKLTGDHKTQAEGKADQTEGRVQNAAGSVKDSAREDAAKSKQDKTGQDKK